MELNEKQKLNLLDKAINKLALQVGFSQGTFEDILRMENLYRMRGDLNKALEYVKLCMEFKPEDEQVKGLHDLMSGEEINSDLGGVQPFLYLPDFLSTPLHRKLLDYVISHKEQATESKLYHGDEQKIVTPEKRLSKTLKLSNDLQAEWHSALEKKLPDIFPRLGVEEFTPSMWEVKALLYGELAHFARHNDIQKLVTASNRFITLVYYFHNKPKRFEGGHVLLYDQNPVNGKPLEVYTRIVPEDNSFLCFYSSSFHEVTKVTLTSSSPDNGRFALVTWLHQ